MSNSVRPTDSSPPDSPHPWNSPGKNTGVGCHFLLQCMKVKSKVTQSCLILSNPWTTTYQAPPSMEFSRQESTGVGCHCLLLIFMYLCDNTADVFLPNMTERFMRKRVRSIFPTNVYSSTQFSGYLERSKCAKHFYEKKVNTI